MPRPIEKMSDAEVLHIAADAVCDPRTVRRHIAGEAIRATVAQRIDDAIAMRRGTVRGDGKSAVKREA
jgi:hypothetical protein